MIGIVGATEAKVTRGFRCATSLNQSRESPPRKVWLYTLLMFLCLHAAHILRNVSSVVRLALLSIIRNPEVM